MPILQIYFMYGFGVCCVFSSAIIILIKIEHRRAIEFQKEMRKLEVDAVREHWMKEMRKV